MSGACTADGCERATHHKSKWCASHRSQMQRFGEIRPFARINGRGLVRDGNGLKQCWACKAWQSESEYHPDSTRRDGLATNCKSCARWIRKRQQYGIDRERFDAMLAEQGNGCAACGASDPGGKTNAWHIDHDHACCPYGGTTCGRCVRGILCHGCNLILGHAKDDPATLRALADYLERTNHAV